MHIRLKAAAALPFVVVLLGLSVSSAWSDHTPWTYPYTGWRDLECQECHAGDHPYYSTWAEWDCRVCHGASVAPRHHSVGRAIDGECLCCHNYDPAQRSTGKDCLECHGGVGLPCGLPTGLKPFPYKIGYRPFSPIMDFVPQTNGTPTKVSAPDKPYYQFSEQDCRWCHGAETQSRHHATDPALNGQCEYCHEEIPVVDPVRDCMLCHTDDPNAYPYIYAQWGDLAFPHHKSDSAQAALCTACHSTSQIVRYNTVSPPSYWPSRITPTPASCENCHFWNDPVSPTIHGSGDGETWGAAGDGLHPDKIAMGFAPNALPSLGTHMELNGAFGAKCYLCHADDEESLAVFDPYNPNTIRYCENCHALNTLHAIPGHLETASIYTVNGVPNQQVTSNEKCVGCHEITRPYSTETTWALTKGGSGNDVADAVVATSDGGFVVAGNTWSFGDSNDTDFWVIRFHASGSVAWEKTYGGSQWEYARAIRQTADGGFIVAGEIHFQGVHVWVLKLHADGRIAWQKTYGGSVFDYVKSIQQTSDGGFILAGKTESFGAGNYDVWVLKLRGDGTVDWQKTYGGLNHDWADSVQETSDGGFVVAGTTTSFIVGTSDMWIFKLDADGTVVWERAYAGGTNEGARAIQRTADGGFVVAGVTEMFSAGDEDVWILKLNSGGFIEWEKGVGGWNADVPHAIEQTSDGGYVVAGETRSFGNGGADAWILRLDSDGNLLWQKSVGGSRNDSAHAIDQDINGYFIVAGGTDSFGSGDDDFWLLKVDADGEVPGCWLVGSTAPIVSFSAANVRGTSAAVQTSTATMADTYETAQNRKGSMVRDACTLPHLAKLNPGPCGPGTKIRIKGVNFGMVQGDSVVHIGNKSFDSTSRKVKLWSDHLIKIKIPNFSCDWFKGKDKRTRKIWITVDGVDSNVKRQKVLKPSTCP